ncbi:MAG: hypothetical protein ABGW69_03590 [Nanoarchaeota archaeon]
MHKEKNKKEIKKIKKKSALSLNAIIISILVLIFLITSTIMAMKFYNKTKNEIRPETNDISNLINQLDNNYNKKEIDDFIFFIASKKDLFEKVRKVINYDNDYVLKTLIKNKEDYELVKENKGKIPLFLAIFIYNEFYKEGCNNDCTCGLQVNQYKINYIKNKCLNLYSNNFEKEENSCKCKYIWSIENCNNIKEAKTINIKIGFAYLNCIWEQLKGDDTSKTLLLLPSYLDNKIIKEEVKNNDQLINAILKNTNDIYILKKYKEFIIFVYSIPIN